jgi:hypothetical protein
MRERERDVDRANSIELVRERERERANDTERVNCSERVRVRVSIHYLERVSGV